MGKKRQVRILQCNRDDYQIQGFSSFVWQQLLPRFSRLSKQAPTAHHRLHAQCQLDSPAPPAYNEETLEQDEFVAAPHMHTFITKRAD